MELCKQALNKGVVITKKNRKYKGVDLYGWKINNKNKFTEDEKRFLNIIIPDMLYKVVNIVDIKTNRIYTYSSITEAGMALCNDFHLVNTEKSGRSTIHNYLSGHTKNPIYKGRFKFEYVN